MRRTTDNGIGIGKHHGTGLQVVVQFAWAVYVYTRKQRRTVISYRHQTCRTGSWFFTRRKAMRSGINGRKRARIALVRCLRCIASQSVYADECTTQIHVVAALSDRISLPPPTGGWLGSCPSCINWKGAKFIIEDVNDLLLLRRMTWPSFPVKKVA
jgi:hypothetical protein